jgi:hypothetical protein
MDAKTLQPLSPTDGEHAAMRYMFVKRMFCGHTDCNENQEFRLVADGTLENSTHKIRRVGKELTVTDKETDVSITYDLETWELSILKKMEGKIGIADAMAVFEALGDEALYQVAKIGEWNVMTESEVMAQFGQNSAITEGSLIRFKDHLIRRKP